MILLATYPNKLQISGHKPHRTSRHSAGSELEEVKAVNDD